MNKDFYLEAMKAQGLADATDLQTRETEMDGTALYSEKQKIPDFQAAKAAKNMLERSIGFVCRSTAGRVVKLLQVYDSNTYPAEPEELPAQWGFQWSKNPADALPFVEMATSPYNTGECCTDDGKVWKSKIDTNTWQPSLFPEYWEEVYSLSSQG